MTPADEKRFWSKVKQQEHCWQWIGTVGGHGYGVFHINQWPYRAHRCMWNLVYGPIPDGIYVCHACDNKKCVRPQHLFLGTNSDNLRDAYKKGRLNLVDLGALSRSKTHCPNGHEYKGYNLYIPPSGKRNCRTCRNAQSNQYKHRKKVAI